MIALRTGVVLAMLASLMVEARSEEAAPPDAAAVPEAAAQVVTAALPRPAPAPVTLAAVIDLTNQRMTVSINGLPTHSWAISSGRAGYSTPTGTFRPQWKARMWHSRKYDMAPMPHSVFFNGGIAVHATSAVGLLGRPASHGCVRLAPGNAATFFGLVTRHGMGSTRITVRGVAPTGMIAQRGQRKRQATMPRGPRPYTVAVHGRPGYRVAAYQVYYVRPLPQRHAAGSWR